MRTALPLLVLLLATGCATGSDEVVFTDGGEDGAKEAGDATGDAPRDATDADATADSSVIDSTLGDTADAKEAEVDPCPGKTSCSGKCVETTNDLDHCGKCDNPCPDRKNAIRTCVASLCGFACNIGFDDCNGDKLDGCETSLDTSTDNCGLCGKACPAVTNADPTCTKGACGYTCKTGYGNCDGTAGCETDTTINPSHCGGCGKACPSGPTTDPVCGGSTCGTVCKSGYVSVSGHCTNMGGAFAKQAGCTGCGNGNPYVSSSCSCPAGFAAGAAFLARTDACGITNSTVQFCETGGGAAGVWGGAFQTDDAVSCGLSCRVANPKTGACNCPSGYIAQYARVLITNTCGSKIGSRIGLCVHPSVALDNFGGAYQVDDPVGGGLGCRMANTRTGGCSCPTGFSAYPIRTLVDSSGGSEIGSQLFECLR
ncbi:MAG: hypothetical protein JNL79_01045 [Myxococcales bacterium]|nr:hypothetical protein [Myxococcales bacterium]